MKKFILAVLVIAGCIYLMSDALERYKSPWFIPTAAERQCKIWMWAGDDRALSAMCDAYWRSTLAAYGEDD